jgi:hypothetical protein
MSVSISVSQSAANPEAVTVTDTSTALSGTIVSRRIYLSDYAGNFLTGDGTVDYTDWPLADASITLSILTQDLAANIKVDWLDINGDVVETYNNNYPLSQFGKNFFFQLVSAQGLTPGIYQDSNYSGNMAIFWANIVAGNNAVTNGNSLSAAQNCYDREINMQQNESKYF